MPKSKKPLTPEVVEVRRQQHREAARRHRQKLATQHRCIRCGKPLPTGYEHAACGDCAGKEPYELHQLAVVFTHRRGLDMEDAARRLASRLELQEFSGWIMLGRTEPDGPPWELNMRFGKARDPKKKARSLKKRDLPDA